MEILSPTSQLIKTYLDPVSQERYIEIVEYLGDLNEDYYATLDNYLLQVNEDTNTHDVLDEVFGYIRRCLLEELNSVGINMNEEVDLDNYFLFQLLKESMELETTELPESVISICEDSEKPKDSWIEILMLNGTTLEEFDLTQMIKDVSPFTVKKLGDYLKLHMNESLEENNDVKENQDLQLLLKLVSVNPTIAQYDVCDLFLNGMAFGLPFEDYINNLWETLNSPHTTIMEMGYNLFFLLYFSSENGKGLTTHECKEKILPYIGEEDLNSVLEIIEHLYKEVSRL